MLLRSFSFSLTSLPDRVHRESNLLLRARLHQTKHQHCDNSAMMLVILFSLKSIELFENRLQPHSGATPLFSMRTISLASLQSCSSIDADAWCKRALRLRKKSLALSLCINGP